MTAYRLNFDAAGPDKVSLVLGALGAIDLAGTLATVAPAAPAQAPAAPATQTAPDTTGVVPATSDSIVEGVGVNTHLGWVCNYQKLADPVVFPALKDLGIRYIRDGITTDRNLIPRLANRGFKLLLNPQSEDSPATVLQKLNWGYKIQDGYAGPVPDVLGLDGMNEPTDVAAADSQTVGLAKAVAADPFWGAKGLVRLSPSFITEAAEKQAGDLSAYITGTNGHGYSGWGMAELYGLPQTAYTKEDGPTLPWFITECGYHTDTSLGRAAPGWTGVTEKAAGFYLPRLVAWFLTNTGYPVAKLFIYELMTQDATTPPGPPLGLMNADGSKRAQYYSLAALLKALADPGAAFTPGKIDVRLSGANPNVVLVPLGRRDGSFDILVWNAVSVYDWPTNADLAVADVSETLTFTRTFKSAQVLRVNDGQSPAWKPLAASTRMALPVGPGVSILRMTP